MQETGLDAVPETATGDVIDAVTAPVVVLVSSGSTVLAAVSPEPAGAATATAPVRPAAKPSAGPQADRTAASARAAVAAVENLRIGRAAMMGS
jgi:hypothetical protein